MKYTVSIPSDKLMDLGKKYAMTDGSLEKDVSDALSRYGIKVNPDCSVPDKGYFEIDVDESEIYSMNEIRSTLYGKVFAVIDIFNPETKGKSMMMLTYSEQKAKESRNKEATKVFYDDSSCVVQPSIESVGFHTPETVSENSNPGSHAVGDCQKKRPQGTPESLWQLYKSGDMSYSDILSLSGD